MANPLAILKQKADAGSAVGLLRDRKDYVDYSTEAQSNGQSPLDFITWSKNKRNSTPNQN